MRRSFLSLLVVLAASCTAASSETIVSDWRFVKVIDGDTVQFEVPGLPESLARVSVRVEGIDTPEKRSKCDAEKKLSKKATDFTLAQLNRPDAEVKVLVRGWDKYGGRVLGRVIVNGADVHAAMVELGLAREYHGQNKNTLPPWPGCRAE